MMFSKRWDYWLRTLEAEKVLDEPIPQIKWTGSGHPDAKKNLEKCLGMIHNRGRRESLDLFVDWLLHGFGDQEAKEFPRGLEPKVSADWYKTFNLGLYLQHPHDYLGDVAAELYGSGKHNPTGYFPTPMHVSVMMAMMTLSEEDKTASVCDPCLGSGRLLMAASNYSLNLYGMDIDYRILRICKLNAWQYIPWMVIRPPYLEGLDKPQGKEPVEQGDSLATPPIQQITKETQQELLKYAQTPIQLNLFGESPQKKR